MRVRRRLFSASLAFAGLVATIGASAASAGATVEELGAAKGFQYLRASGSFGGSGTFDVPCPQGMGLVGGGADVIPTGSPSAVTSLRVASSSPFGETGRRPKNWRGTAHNLGQVLPPNLEVYAVCRKAGPTGIEYREVDKTYDTARGTAKLNCPDRTSVTSGGVTGGAPGSVWMMGSIPFDDKDANKRPDDGWKVVMRNPTGEEQSLRAYALCLAPGRDNLRYISMNGTEDYLTVGSATTSAAFCGPAAISAGAILRGQGDGWFGILGVMDDADEGTMPEDAAGAYAYNKSGDAKTLDAVAICFV